MKTIVVADDHAFSAAGIADALQNLSNFDVIGVATNGIEAIKQVKKLQPSCAIFDHAMPGANGLEAFVEAKRWSPKTRFAIITGSGSPAILQELLGAGIDGLFVKSSAPEDICRGIEKMSDGEQVVSDEAQDMLEQAALAAQERESLTVRELEVLQAIAKGLTNGQIADHLSVSPKTIDSHRTSLMRKMGVHTTATLLVRAMRDGLIDVSIPN